MARGNADCTHLCTKCSLNIVLQVANGENAIDLLNAQFGLDRALRISQQARNLNHNRAFVYQPIFPRNSCRRCCRAN